MTGSLISASRPRSRRQTLLSAALCLAVSMGITAGTGAGEVSPSSPVPTTEQLDDAQIVAKVNELVARAWKDAGVRPSPQATDGEFLRRIFLDVVGRIPSIDEASSYLNERGKQRKAALVDRLLGDQYVIDYGNFWGTIWTNLLIGRTGGQNPRSLVNRDGMSQYLRRSFYRNKPYDRMVYELLTATGVNRPGEEGYNGAVNFLLAHLDDNAIQATARTSRLFLGMQVQCTQCHNHPFNDWKQSQFWQLNAFFRQARALRSFAGRNIAKVELVDEDFVSPSRDMKEAEIYYEARNGRMAVAYPVFVDGTAIDPSGYVREVNRRQELARLVVGSEAFARAAVNRMWAHFFGYGFTKPVDDMGPHNPPSHPELLDFLARQFSAHGYDLKRLIRWLVLSKPYALSSRQGHRNEIDDPSSGEPPLFSRFYLRQMSPEQLYDSLLVATAAEQAAQGNETRKEQMRRRWLAQFTIAFGTDENDEATVFNGSIPQVLMMMNGELTKTATRCEPGTFLHDVAMSDEKPSEKITRLYIAALTRRPSTQEVRAANQVWQAHQGDTIAALQDIWWALLNSNEFILIH